MKFLKRDISKKTFWILIAAFTLFRLLLTASWRITLIPDTSMFDDYLVYEAARNVSAGNWLGEYSYLTIGKHMLFAVWLALLNALGLPYFFTGQALFSAAALMLVLAFSPVIQNRLHLLIFYIFLVFTPAGYADYTLRVYRDNISTAVFMMAFAAVIGFALRAPGKRIWPLFLYGAAGGLALGASFLLREDGLWLLPFAAVGGIVIIIRIFREAEQKKLRRLLALALTAAFPLLAAAGFSAVNQKNYGRFTVSDLTSAEFYAACGAMTRVAVPEGDYNPVAPLPASLRQKLYDISPAFRELQPYLESEEFRRMRKDVGGSEDYSGGGYYWAVRWAASLAGHYATPETARGYFLRLAGEINAACDSGTVESAGSRRSGLNAPITASRVAPTFKEVLNELGSVLFYTGIRCSPAPSEGSDAMLGEMESYLHTAGFALSREYTGDSLIILTASSDSGSVSVSLENQNGERLPIEITPATGGDVYVRRLLATGEDFLDSDLLRRYLRFPGSSDECFLILTVNGKSEKIPAIPSAPSETGVIRYSVEYAGADYTFTSESDYGFFEIWTYRAARGILMIYKILNPILLAAGMAAFFFAAARLIKNRKAKQKTPAAAVTHFCISAGLLLMSLLRLFMIAFMEVTAFGIGTYPMYFAVVFPLTIAFSFSSLTLFLNGREPSARFHIG